jgi:hypothetical protein
MLQKPSSQQSYWARAALLQRELQDCAPEGRQPRGLRCQCSTRDEEGFLEDIFEYLNNEIELRILRLEKQSLNDQ